ncbi:peptidylprolyl isomerase [Hydrotalea sp.]|uniref:peptidylprolyl isomerase n=1 Tax=Hydrotalea sp. TaxID=2881279 RepID=UPI002584912A|nr:peptidylprolyl isomerase [Hydrotalea sp.]
MKSALSFVMLLTWVTLSFAQKPVKEKERHVLITTPFGNMVAKLYNNTPNHRDNFIKNVAAGAYDSTIFHRVIAGFMIQGGDPATKKLADTSAMQYTSTPPDQQILPEFRNDIIHERGALAAARDGNPRKASHAYQFYIVQGKTFDSTALETHYQQRVKPANPNFHYTKEQAERYARIGGTPYLDQQYTVFGQVISGLEVIDKIAAQSTNKANRPLKNIRITITLLN